LAVASSLTATFENGELGISITSDSGTTTSAVVAIGTGPATYQHLMTMQFSNPNGAINGEQSLWTSDASSYFTDLASFKSYLATLPEQTLGIYGSSTMAGTQATHNIYTTYNDGTNTYAMLFNFHDDRSSAYSTPIQVPNGVYSGITRVNNDPQTDVAGSIVFSDSSVAANFMVDGQITNEDFSRYAFASDFTDTYTAGTNYAGTLETVSLSGDNLV